jgi:hypothetical protein
MCKANHSTEAKVQHKPDRGRVAPLLLSRSDPREGAAAFEEGGERDREGISRVVLVAHHHYDATVR